MNANEFRMVVDKLADGLTRDQKLAILNRTLGWLTADVSDGTGERRLRLMIATQIRQAIKEQVDSPGRLLTAPLSAPCATGGGKWRRQCAILGQ